jgi:heme exporter protein A
MSENAIRPLIEMRGVIKRFGHVTALSGVDYQVVPGEAVTLFGPNGAGKTTLLRMIAGLSRPTEGELLLDGEPVIDGADEALRRRIGYISHQSLTYGRLTARENLLFFARLYGVPDEETKVETLLQEVGLSRRADDVVDTFSRGMKQRLSIARALVHDPDIILLDEPFTGLDQHAAEMLKRMFASLREKGRTLIMITHNLAVGIAMSGRVAVQVAGRIVIDEPTAGIDPVAFTERYYQAVGEAHY